MKNGKIIEIDKQIDFDKYQEYARRTQNHNLTDEQRLLHALHGISAEAGEIHGIYQKQYQGHPVDQGKVLDEASDLLWFLAELADCIGVSLANIARYNVAKLIARYPEGFSEDRSIHRQQEGGR